MKKILVTWIIIAILLTSGLTIIGFKIKEKNEVYLALEKDIKQAAQIYLSQYSSYSSNIILDEELIKHGILIDFKNGEEKCVGYVLVKKEYFKNKYYPFIKCQKYTTKGYDKNV